MPQFHNPYNFIPLGEGTKERGAPKGHHRLHDELYTGTITVKLTTVTPLLIVDPETSDQKEHKTFSEVVKKPGTNIPDIPITSLRGMLRSAYEAITESRFGVWSKKDHDLRLGFRLGTNIGAQVVPARVVNGELRLFLGAHAAKLCPGGKCDTAAFIRSTMSGDKPPGSAPDGLQYAAWLPIRSFGSLKHKEEVNFHSELFERHLWNRNKRTHGWSFNYYKVRSCGSIGSGIAVPAHSPPVHKQEGCSWHNSRKLISGLETGFVVKTGYNIKNKHDERVFYGEVTTGIAITDEHRKAYENLVIDYHKQHMEDIAAGETTPASDRKRRKEERTTYSRHVMESRKKLAVSETNVEGQFVYALFDGAGKLQKLFPVMISRDLFDDPPSKCLPENFLPAKSLDQASPADRLFGFVNPEGQGSYKAQVKISRIEAQSAKIKKISDGLSLAILGQPKPSMGPFYLADRKGQPVETKDGSYKRGEGQKIRGRKVYLIHKAAAAYWDPSQNSNQEYKAPCEVGKSTQNKTIKEWVEKDSTFTFQVQVTNCTEAELSALLWLLDLGNLQERGLKGEYCLSLGGGKPLGFGAVKLEITHASLSRGSDWSKCFKELSRKPAPLNYKELINCATFDKDVKVAFLTAAKGIQLSDFKIHYPRVKPYYKSGKEITERGELNFEWYRRTRQSGGSLPLLKDLKPFSTDVEAPSRQNNYGGQGGNRNQGSRDQGNRGQAGGRGSNWNQGGRGGGYNSNRGRNDPPGGPPSQGRRR